MELTVNKESGIPLYKQVKYSITEKIQSGELNSGFRLPTERELSEQLAISRNTVSAAYKDLEKEGLLVSRQGKGTFVAEDFGKVLSGELHERILSYVDLGLEEALAGGMEARDYLRMVEQRVSEKIESLRTAHAIYVECNPEQARYYARQIEEGTNLNCQAVTVAELIEMSDETRSLLHEASVIIATANHVPEVQEYTRDFGKAVLGVAANPDLQTMVKIARYPEGTRFAFISISLEFKDKVKEALQGAGLTDLDITYSNSKDPNELAGVLQDKDIILVSPGRYKDVSRLVDRTRILPMQYNLDQGSMTTLKQRLLELNII